MVIASMTPTRDFIFSLKLVTGPDGPNSGEKVFEEDDFEKAIELYYDMIGCNPETGRPDRGKLLELGLEWVEELL